LRRLLGKLRAAFPTATFRVRLDGGFAHPKLFPFLARQQVEYVVAMASNRRLEKRARRLYRDLGVTAASSGRMRAQIMSATEGMTKPTGWHYHVCDGQFVYALQGWVDLEFEDGQTIRLQAGESMYIPGGLRHNEIATSDTLEILEVSVPADMGTVPCDPPEGGPKRP